MHYEGAIAYNIYPISVKYCIQRILLQNPLQSPSVNGWLVYS